ncbi:transcriptional regulator, TetR family [Modestobacter sp. DSM 44400]|nr:transcriptional regulator, TetR family [Modestobacter sp. DSM 44400]
MAHGYAGLSMQQVCRVAGVSNGSLYHHFPSRADLAARLLATGMRACQLGVLGVLAGEKRAETGVREVVRSQLAWVEEHAELAQVLFSDLPDEVLLAAEPTFSQDNRRYVEEIGAWLRRHATNGELLERPFGVAHALWLGSSQEFARHWLRGRSRLTPTAAADELADGAWHALSAP